MLFKNNLVINNRFPIKYTCTRIHVKVIITRTKRKNFPNIKYSFLKPYTVLAASSLKNVIKNLNNVLFLVKKKKK